MKSLFALLSLFILNTAIAQDMSHTEDFNAVYVENEQGFYVYVGGCSLHEDYADSRFAITKTLLEYIQDDELKPENFAKLTKDIDPKLLSQVAKDHELEWSENVDDLTVFEIVYFNKPELKLFRLNIGVGGGNGMFVNYLQTIQNGKIEYTQVAYTFDGDLEFCDNIVWTK